MAYSCEFKSKAEYGRLQRLAGIPESSLSRQAGRYWNEYGRLPEVDEIAGADSSDTLISDYDLKERGSRFYGDMDRVGDPVQASATINNTYKDLEVKVMQFGEKALFDSTRRPNIGRFYDVRIEAPDSIGRTDNRVALSVIADKLRNVYGIPVNLIDVSERHDELNGIDWKSSKGFIHNGQIYLNLANAGLDTPIHEMMHLLLGELKYHDADLYRSLVGSMAQLPDFAKRRDGLYKYYAMEDAMEEMFVTEVAKHYGGYENAIDRLPKRVKSLISYRLKRMIDTVLMGQDSAHALPDTALTLDTSLLDMCRILGSTIADTKTKENDDYAFSHRMLANMKRDLIKNDELVEEC